MPAITPTNNFATINGAQIYYEEAGAGFPLVMLHAGIADLRMWDDQFPFFAQHFRAIRYDMRGFGRSKMVRGRFSNHADLYALLQQLGVQRAYLMGCSLGGETVIDFVLEHPEMAAALVTVSSSMSGYEFEGRPPAELDAILDALKHNQPDQAAEIAARLWLEGRKRKPEQVDPLLRQKMLEMAKPALGVLGMQQNHQPLQPPAAERLDALELPLLAVVGDLDDKNIERAADALVAAVPSGKKVILSDTAHLPNMERPEDFNRIVLSFLQGL